MDEVADGADGTGVGIGGHGEGAGAGESGDGFAGGAGAREDRGGRRAELGPVAGHGPRERASMKSASTKSLVKWIWNLETVF